MKPTRFLRNLLLANSLLAAVTTANAQSTWDGDTSNNWGTSANWNNNTVPNATGASAIFTSASSSGYDIFLGAAGRTANLTFDSSTGSTPYTIKMYDIDGTTIRTLTTGGITVQAGSHTIEGPKPGSGTAGSLTLQNNTAFDISAGATLTLDARLRSGAGTNNYTKTGTGTLILNADSGGGSSWGLGTFSVNAGIVRMDATNASGFSGNKYTVASGAAIELNANFASANGAQTISGSGIGGTGAIRSLSGNRTFGTTSSTGSLTLAADSAIGVDAGSLNIGLAIGESGGSRSLTKVGAGLLTLSNANTFSGSTTISAGTLEVRGSIATSSGIANSSSLVFTSDSAQSFANVISGTGTLTKLGTDILTLTGGNTYTGDTIINQGILQVGDGGTTGRLGGNGTSTASNTSIDSGAVLRINRSSTGYDYHGVLSGSGTVNIISGSRMNFRTVANQTSSGDLSFALEGTLGVNTTSGVTQVYLGELGGSGTIQRAGTAGGAATIQIGGKGTDSIFSGRITATELGVEKVGNGTLTLTGTNNDYAGGTTVTAGTLLVNGALTSSSNAVNIGLNGTLGGNGTIAGATTVNGNLTPGTSAGVLSFSSSLALTASSSTTMEITGTGMIRGTDYDGINVGSSLVLNGDLTLDLDTVFSAGSYTFNLFNAVGSTSGNFESVTLSGAYGAEPMTFGSGVWSATTDVNGGETWSFSQSSGELTLTVIPEPRAALLGGLGLLMLLRRKRTLEL